ncbi:MAG: 50S ribosomal protein L11 [Candidatus Micrarchaeia archaeon]
MKVTIQALVEGGKASAGPPLGPSLGPLGVNIPAVIAAINEKTKEFAGLSIPVKVIVDKETKSFEIEVGMPPTSALIKKELGVEKGAKTKGEKIGNLTLAQVVKIAKIKSSSSLSKDITRAVKEVLGTCLSMGVSCEGKDAREVIREIDEGKHKLS